MPKQTGQKKQKITFGLKVSVISLWNMERNLKGMHAMHIKNNFQCMRCIMWEWLSAKDILGLDIPQMELFSRMESLLNFWK